MKRGKSTLSRGAVAAALGLVGTERCVDALLVAYGSKHLKDEERALALASLGRICDPLAIPNYMTWFQRFGGGGSVTSLPGQGWNRTHNASYGQWFF